MSDNDNNYDVSLTEAEINRLSTQAAIAYMARNSLGSPEEITKIMDKVRENLKNNTAITVQTKQIEQKKEEEQEQKQEQERLPAPNPKLTRDPSNPAVDPKKSVFDEHIICLEDGKEMKMLKRHLMNKYDLTPEAYRRRWGLPNDYPMSAPATTQKRSQGAIERGFGKTSAKTPADQPPAAETAPETAPEENTEA
ncbi:MucR family transcriptional regulator [Gluconobacter cerinus]|uniref:MucR family transcriptional regulator n=1 Tax=Gluconobacter cerinus TaxID=38307 RepID=UPI001B8C1318|nr:MucR family transcriptional regulator [Gluconobacter cerinus]MBS1035557.1 MucR family transcriptional regulator [Gluconobacter cerinus]